MKNPVIEVHKPQQQGYTLLVVDDNAEFLDFLCASLSTSYRVLKASDGETALKIAHDKDVDLIITDVMMPGMSGTELCTKIKTDIATSHIPVIMLTAKAGEDCRIEGLSTGADDYIEKPFNMEILKLRINKFIENSIHEHQVFQQQVNIEPSRIEITPLDQQFIDKAIQLVEQNIANEDFSVEQLAEGLNLSRGYLHRKISKITGKTPLEFIRIIRMKRAQQMLAESQMQVAEVAYALGYSSPKTFTRHFKQEFGISPSEYLKSINS